MTLAPQVSLVGAGPGPVDLLTLRGLRCLQAADAVLVDALVDPAFRELAPQAMWIDVGKRGGRISAVQARICAQMVVLAQCGFKVVRLKGGDPSLFARAEEEMYALSEAGISFEVIPGVTAALAAAADARAPLTRRGVGRAVTFRTAVTKSAGEVLALETPEQTDTLVLYMAGQQLAALPDRLASAGWSTSTPILLVKDAGGANSSNTLTNAQNLPCLAVQYLGRPTIVIVGAGAVPIGQASSLQPTAKSSKVHL